MVTGKKLKRRTPSAKVNKDTEQSTQRKKIRIRMYCVGFGDCFLLSLPAENGESADRYRHILIDCGVHTGGDIVGNMEKVVDNIAEITERQLDIIVATHAHKDHISGFEKFKELFARFELREVWLPWTWDENNRKARKLQEKHAALTDRL